MGKRGVAKIATLGAWGIRRKETAAELGIRGVRKQQGRKRRVLSEDGRGERSNEEALLASSRKNAPAVTEVLFRL